MLIYTESQGFAMKEILDLLNNPTNVGLEQAGYNSWPCYNNSRDESLAPGDQIVGFYLISGLCPAF